MTGPSRATLTAAIIALVAGGVLVVVGVVHVVRDVVHTVNAPVVLLPADLHKDLETGDYDVYQRTGTNSGGDGINFGESSPATLTPNDVTVTAPDGTQVPTGYIGGGETITRNGAVYTAAVRFTVPRSDTYEVRIGSGEPGGNSAIVAESFEHLGRGLLRWIALLAGGGLVALAALVVIIIVSVQANRRRRQLTPAPVAAAAPPPGWYPDPGGSGRHRWWDGARWTDHVG